MLDYFIPRLNNIIKLLFVCRWGMRTCFFVFFVNNAKRGGGFVSRLFVCLSLRLHHNNTNTSLITSSRMSLNESESEPTWLALPPASTEEAEAGGIKRSFSTDEYDEEDDKSKIRRLESELTDAKTELVFLTGVLNSMDATATTTETKTAAAASCAFVDCGCSFPNSWTLVKHIREFHFNNLSCTECDAKFHDPWSKRRHMQKEHAQEQQPTNDDVLTLAIDESHLFQNDEVATTTSTEKEEE